MNVETVEYRVSNTPFEIPKVEGFAESQPGIFFITALDKLNEFSGAKAAINADANLSFVGRGAKLKPLEEALWRQIATSALNLDGFGRHLDTLEAAMLDIGQPVTPYDIARDAEVRAWWRNLSQAARLEALTRIEADPEKHDAVVKAVLRSPIPSDLGDGEARLLAELNDKARRADKPEIAVRLDDGRKALVAAQRGMGHVQGLATSATEWNGERLLSFTLTNDGEDYARALGFSDEQIIRAKQAAQAKRLMAA